MESYFFALTIYSSRQSVRKYIKVEKIKARADQKLQIPITKLFYQLIVTIDCTKKMERLSPMFLCYVQFRKSYFFIIIEIYKNTASIKESGLRIGIRVSSLR